MWHKKNRIVIGMIANGTALLHVSVPAIARLKDSVTLIIHNGNPDIPVRRRDIRRMGYRGHVRIINGAPEHAYTQIINAVPSHAQWIIFTNAGDVLADIDTTPAGDDNFAIIKNTISVRRFSELMNAAYYGTMPTHDGDAVILHRPNTTLGGTPIRISAVRGAVTDTDTGDEKQIWTAIREHVTQSNPNATAIFMDTVSCITANADAAAAPRG